jgi:hypothetical protein
MISFVDSNLLCIHEFSNLNLKLTQSNFLLNPHRVSDSSKMVTRDILCTRKDAMSFRFKQNGYKRHTLHEKGRSAEAEDGGIA